MFESTLKYCPHCKDEYRSEFDTCAACDALLLNGEEMSARYGNPSPDKAVAAEINVRDDLVSLQKGNLLDLKLLKNLLAKHQIPAVLIKDEQCRSGCCGGVEVILQVRLQDGEMAAALLHEEYLRSTGLDKKGMAGEAVAYYDSEAPVAVCPACGHSFTPDRPDCPDCGLSFN